MIFDELVLHNYGIYRGRQTVAMTPPKKSRPVILFGGLNGHGKTTLLDALNLALYGKRAKCAHRGRKGYEDFLRDSIHRGVDASEGAAVELAFRHRMQGEEHSFRVHRSWTPTANGVTERIEVLKDGQFDTVLTESWQEYVEQFLPLGVAHLFLFDAEQIKGFADFDKARELLTTAMRTLLGLDMVEQLTTDLGVLIRRVRAEGASDETQAQIRAREAEVESIQARMDDATAETAAARTRLDRLTKARSDVEADFRRQGGDLYERRKELERERQVIEAELAAADDRLRVEATGCLPLSLVHGRLTALRDAGEAGREAHEAGLLLDMLEARDRAVLEDLRDESLNDEVLSVLEQVLEQDRAQRSEARADIGKKPALSTDALSQISGLLDGGLNRAATRASELLDERRAIQRRADEMDRRLAQIPDDDAIASLMLARSKAESALKQAESKLRALEESEEAVRRELEQAQEALEKILVASVEERHEADARTRTIQHSERMRETMQKFERAVSQRHVDDIRELILKSFERIARKDRLVGDLTIDPVDYTLRLKDSTGADLPADRLSAGERQLLAVAILWGLAQAAPRPLPAVIDTPLGRLDSSHRRHLVERYFPNASHQVLLLSTDEEIDERYYDLIEKFVGRCYHLDYDEQLRSTTISEGYFWETHHAV